MGAAPAELGNADIKCPSFFRTVWTTPVEEMGLGSEPRGKFLGNRSSHRNTACPQKAVRAIDSWFQCPLKAWVWSSALGNVWLAVSDGKPGFRQVARPRCSAYVPTGLYREGVGCCQLPW